MKKTDVLVALWDKYKSEIGGEPTTARLRKAAEYIRRRRLAPDDVRFEQHADEMWNQRSNRTIQQRRAVCVGATGPSKPGHARNRVWIVPRERKETTA